MAKAGAMSSKARPSVSTGLRAAVVIGLVSLPWVIAAVLPAAAATRAPSFAVRSAPAAPTPTTTAPPPAPAAAVGPTQAVVVSAPSAGTSDATVTAYQWDGTGWQVAIGAIEAQLGANGFTTTPHEGDGFTPTGQYRFTVVFGSLPDPDVSMPYRQATAQDFWVDDPTSALYNTWQHGAAAGRWTSAEELNGYSYAAAFDFNQNPVVPNGNSAIFLHEGGVPTAGCIAVDQASLLRLLRWLDPAAQPVIVLGVGATPPAR
jgi:L,D-peptidoglycan transpeptidase YkuD (ErfK/YbiS/YcfS/YnhG family)